MRVPKNGISRSKRLLKPQSLPHQHWVLELRTSLTKAEDGAKCAAKFADTLHVIYIEVTSASQTPTTFPVWGVELRDRGNEQQRENHECRSV